MSQSTTVTPFEVGAMSAVIGAGVGYAMAPRKYNLEQLLTIEPDVFEKSLPQTALAKATDDQKIAHSVITDARKDILTASKKNAAEERLRFLLKSADLDDAYKTIKGLLPKARIQAAVVLGIIGGAIGTIAKMIYDQKNAMKEIM